VELVVVTGRNARAREGLLREPVPSRHRVQILGYTDQLDELMAVADLVVSKPGGLTTSETLARGAGLVVVNPVPGQEDRNSDYLLENGAAIKVNHIPTLAAKLTALLRDPKRVAEIKANSRRLGRPYAAFEVVRHALSLLPSSAYRGLPFTPGPPRSRIESSTGNGTMRGGDGNHVALRAALEPNLV